MGVEFGRSGHMSQHLCVHTYLVLAPDATLFSIFLQSFTSARLQLPHHLGRDSGVLHACRPTTRNGKQVHKVMTKWLYFALCCIQFVFSGKGGDEVFGGMNHDGKFSATLLRLCWQSTKIEQAIRVMDCC